MSLNYIQPILFGETTAREYLLSKRVFYDELGCQTCETIMRERGRAMVLPMHEIRQQG